MQHTVGPRLEALDHDSHATTRWLTEEDLMEAALHMAPRRAHLVRLMSIWRSAGWPCRDAIELDLLAAGWVRQSESPAGHETIRLTEAGIRLLAEARQRNQRSLSAHDRLSVQVAAHLSTTGRIVWRELSLRALVGTNDELVADEAQMPDVPLWPEDKPGAPGGPRTRGKASWRMARPDVFSVRNTAVESYLQPMVHEVKVSRADLLSDLRHAAKRESYRWLSCETYYVLPTGTARLEEIPPEFGVWVLEGSAGSGRLELARPAPHVPCKLPFLAWMALAKATPFSPEEEAPQSRLGDVDDEPGSVTLDIGTELPTAKSVTE